MNDAECMREYLESGSEAAFRALVRRHLDLVYATALRRLGNPALAEEATQNVFILLARKAVLLAGRKDLAGWLYKTALLKARELAREEWRRNQREQQAVLLGTTMKPDDSLLKALASVLDEAVLELREKDRQALLLRFFEGKSLKEVGAALGIGEDAAQKRVAQALELLARAFRKRGYAVAGTGAVVAALRGAAQAAPPGLLASVTQVALTRGAVSAAGFSLVLTKLMTLTKTQTAALCLLLGAAPVAYHWHALDTARATRDQQRQQLDASREQLAALEARRRQTERRLEAARQTTMELGAALRRRQQADALAANGPGAPLYRWAKDSAYVRVPKSILNQLTLADESNAVEETGGIIGKSRPVLREDGSVAGLLVEALDVQTNQAAALHESLAQFARDYAALAQQHSQFIPTPPGTHGLPGDSKTLATSRFPEEGGELERRLRQELEAVLGAERTAIFWHQAKPDFLYFFGNFGRAENKTTVVRDPNTVDASFFVMRDVRESDEERDYRSARFKPDELPQSLRRWWPDLTGDKNNANAQQP